MTKMALLLVLMVALMPRPSHAQDSASHDRVIPLLLGFSSDPEAPLNSAVLRRSNVLFTANFNTYNPTEIESLRNDGVLASMSLDIDGNPLGVFDDEARFATPAAKLLLDRSSLNSERTEIRPFALPASHFDSDDNARFAQVYWYAQRVFLPLDWESDNSSEIIMQWHGEPDRNASGVRVEGTRPPVLAVYLRPRVVNGVVADMYYEIRIRADPRATTPPSGTPNRFSEIGYDLGTISFDRGRWVDWVFRVRWSYFSSGEVTVWKDAGQVIRHLGPNAYNDNLGPFFKTGVYKWPWNPLDASYVDPSESLVTARELYIDDIRLGSGLASYNDVAPRQYEEMRVD